MGCGGAYNTPTTAEPAKGSQLGSQLSSVPHPQAHNLSHTRAGQASAVPSPLPEMPTRGLPGPLPGRLAARPERNHWLPSEPPAQHPVFPAHPESTGHQGNCLGELPRARGARLSPPGADPENSPRLGKRWGSAEGRTAGSQARGLKARSTSPNTHPSFFQGAWPQHPTDEPGAAPGPRRPPELLSPPSWAGPVVSERAWVPGVAIPSPKPPDRAPRPPAPPPTRPRDAQEPSERPLEATDPGEAPRGAARRPGARLAHRPSQPARACGPGRTGAHSDPAGLPAPDVQRAPPTRAGRRALPAALQRTFSPPGSEEAARPASSAGTRGLSAGAAAAPGHA